MIKDDIMFVASRQNERNDSMTLSDVITASGIPAAAGIPFSSCRVTKRYMLDRLGFVPESAYIGIIPYLSEEFDRSKKKTVSAYAAAKDYHIFIKNTGEEIIGTASGIFPGYRFSVCGDVSPIDERDAAAKAGLGVIGDNGLLITEDYSSFVFIFEILTDLPPDTPSREPGRCIGCGRCRRACPVFTEGIGCLSSVTQKKGDLSPEEKKAIVKFGTAWGCDICQNVCPFTEKARKKGTIWSPIGFFNENVLPSPTPETLADDADFAGRAYSWRPKSVIERNLKLLTDNTIPENDK